jgi:hypothetical protein
VNQAHTDLVITVQTDVNHHGVTTHIQVAAAVVLVVQEQISLTFKLAVTVVLEDIMETFLVLTMAKVVGSLEAAEAALGALPLVAAVTAVLVAEVLETLQQETEMVLALEEQVALLQEFLVHQTPVVEAVALVKLAVKLLVVAMVAQELFLLDTL